MTTVLAFLAFAAEAHGETSKTPFYVLGALAAAFAVAISVAGITQPDFPRSDGAAKAVYAVAAVIVLAVMAAAVLTS